MVIYTPEALLVGAIVGISLIVFGWLFKDIAKHEMEKIAKEKVKDKIDLHEEIYHNKNNE